jgi:hypothetical protein
MKLTVIPASGHVAIDGEAHVLDLSTVENKLIDARALQIHWTGTHGELHRASRVAGKVDLFHFDDVALVEPFVQAFAAHKQKLAEEAAAREVELKQRQEAIAAEAVALEGRAQIALEAQKPKAPDAG